MDTISLTLRKHGYSNILEILPPKNETFHIKKKRKEKKSVFGNIFEKKMLEMLLLLVSEGPHYSVLQTFVIFNQSASACMYMHAGWCCTSYYSIICH